MGSPKVGLWFFQGDPGRVSASPIHSLLTTTTTRSTRYAFSEAKLAPFRVLSLTLSFSLGLCVELSFSLALGLLSPFFYATEGDSNPLSSQYAHRTRPGRKSFPLRCLSRAFLFVISSDFCIATTFISYKCDIKRKIKIFQFAYF